jgi:hypothetical protein
MSELGLLGNVDYHANLPAALAVQQDGRLYRIVSRRIVDGEVVDSGPFDFQTFDSVHAARAHLKTLKAKFPGC